MVATSAAKKNATEKLRMQVEKEREKPPTPPFERTRDDVPSVPLRKYRYGYRRKRATKLNNDKDMNMMMRRSTLGDPAKGCSSSGLSPHHESGSLSVPQIKVPAHWQPRLTVVLDLDETLVYSVVASGTQQQQRDGHQHSSNGNSKKDRLERERSKKEESLRDLFKVGGTSTSSTLTKLPALEGKRKTSSSTITSSSSKDLLAGKVKILSVDQESKEGKTVSPTQSLSQRTGRLPEVNISSNDPDVLDVDVDGDERDGIFFITANDSTIEVHERPQLREFLAEASLLFDLYVFTASSAEYADQIIDHIDPKNEFFKGRLYRKSCTLVEGTLVKDLRNISRDINLARTVLVDDRAESFAPNPLNGIHIAPFRGLSTKNEWKPLDNELHLLLDHLMELDRVSDVRSYAMLGSPKGLKGLNGSKRKMRLTKAAQSNSSSIRFRKSTTKVGSPVAAAKMLREKKMGSKKGIADTGAKTSQESSKKEVKEKMNDESGSKLVLLKCLKENGKQSSTATSSTTETPS
eukprot:g1545.t1